MWVADLSFSKGRSDGLCQASVLRQMCTAVAGPPVSRPPLDLTLFGCSLQFQKILESPSPEQQVTPVTTQRGGDQHDGWVVTGLGWWGSASESRARVSPRRPRSRRREQGVPERIMAEARLDHPIEIPRARSGTQARAAVRRLTARVSGCVPRKRVSRVDLLLLWFLDLCQSNSLMWELSSS